MKIAVYPGTFDPITNGHADLVARAAKIFDKVIIAVAHETGKNTVFSVDERVQFAASVLSDIDNAQVTEFEGLLVDFCRQQQATTVIRGLRAVSDFEFEFQLAGMNRHLAPEVETIFLTPAQQYAFLSSSLVKEVARLNGDVADFVHPMIHQALSERFNQKV